jgi:pullulanase
MNIKSDMDKLQFLTQQDRLVVFTIGGNANGDTWRDIIVAYNGGDAAASVTLPAGAWFQVVNDKKAGVATLAEASGAVSLPPFSMAVLHN